MTCQSCAERRRAAFDALFAGKLAEAAREVREGVKEMVKGKSDGKE